MQNRRTFLQTIPALALGSLGMPSGAIAQAGAWPSRPIRLIVPSNPGSVSDSLTRTFGHYLAAQTRQPVITDNRPGANTIIGAEAAKKAAPDGYTFFCAGTSSHSASPALYSKLRYDPAKDFAEVGMFGVFPYLVLVRKDSPYRSIADLIDAAKAQPGKISSGYSGSSTQTPLELLKVRAGVNIITAAYKAAPQVVNDVAAGQIDFAILASGSAGSVKPGGLLRALAVTSTERMPALPDVPTVAEKLPGFVYEGWLGLSAPAHTPMPVLERMNRYVRDFLADPAMRGVLEQLVIQPVARTLAEQAAFVAADRKRFMEMIRIAKIPPIN